MVKEERIRKVYIFLPVHNRREVTERFVECLKVQTVQSYHLLLIDDGSTDGTEEMVRRRIGSMTVIRGKGNWWWAGALQQGYRWLKSKKIDTHDIVLIINDDTRFEPDFLEKALRVLGARQDILLLAQSYGQSSGKLRDRGTVADWKNLRFRTAAEEEEVNCLATRGLFLKVGTFRRIGGFHPWLLPHFTSDYEFTIRAHRKGFRLMTDPSVRLWVNEETTWNRWPDDANFVAFIKQLFSKKSPINPIVWTFFIALACPWRWKLAGWVRVWGGTGVLLAKRLVGTGAGGGASGSSLRAET